jgi:hypothetical protein
MLKRGVKIHFAHRTFQWSSEARGKAAVHCVIIGFALLDTSEKWLFDYETPQAEAHAIKAGNINPYLVDAITTFIERRSRPLASGIPKMAYGSMPIDKGNLIISEEERASLLATSPKAERYIKRYLGGDCLQQFPVAGKRDGQTKAKHRGSRASDPRCPRKIPRLLSC